MDSVFNMIGITGLFISFLINWILERVSTEEKDKAKYELASDIFMAALLIVMVLK